MKIQSIPITKVVWTKGFNIDDEEQHTTQEDCKGKCKWRSIGRKNWHVCINCGTQEFISK